MPRRGYVWVKAPEKVTFTAGEKSEWLAKLAEFIAASKKLKEKVQSSDMRGNRLYLYEHLEPFQPAYESEFIKWHYARITFRDKTGNHCTADWQRANEKWIEFHKGTFAECLEFIENEQGFF